MAHRSFHTFETLNNHLRLTVDHAASIYPDRVSDLAAFECENRYPQNRLFVVLRTRGEGGAITHLETGETTPLVADSLLLIPGDQGYRFRFEPGLSLVAVHFRLETPGGQDLFHDRRDVACLTGGWRARGAALLQALEDGQSVAHLVAARGAILQLAAAFLSTDVAALRETLRVQSVYQPLLDLVGRESPARPRVEDAARSMGMTADTLSRRYRQDTGMTLKSFLDRQLYQRSAASLLYTDQSVKEIAADYGFSSAFYFSRFFKRHAGMSPSAFRDQDEAYARR